PVPARESAVLQRVPSYPVSAPCPRYPREAVFGRAEYFPRSRFVESRLSEDIHGTCLSEGFLSRCNGRIVWYPRKTVAVENLQEAVRVWTVCGFAGTHKRIRSRDEWFASV